MSLTTDLKAHADASAEKIPQELQHIMKNATNTLHESEMISKAIKTGDTLPQITLPNSKGELTSIQSLLNNGPIVLTFYRGGWCPYCNLELKAFQKTLPEIKAKGAQLLAITPETPDNSLSTSEKNSLDFEILTDQNNHVAKALGLVFTLPPDLVKVYLDFGIDLIKSNNTDTQELPLAATYVINTDGTIVYHFIDVDYKLRADPKDIIKVLP